MQHTVGELWEFALGMLGVDVQHLDAVGVGVLHMVCLGRIVKSGLPEGPRRLDGHRTTVLRVIAPLRGIKEVRAPVGNDPTGVVPDPAEVEVNTVFGVRRPRRGA